MRYCAKLGFRFTHEKLDEEGNPTSIWVEEIVPRTYKADVISTGYNIYRRTIYEDIVIAFPCGFYHFLQKAISNQLCRIRWYPSYSKYI